MTTLFALLLWPVLFHPLPGAFETPYQTAPLDLGEDTFAPARYDLLEARLGLMGSTSEALAMLRDADSRERPNLTWAVGVNWEYGAEDLEELLECIGGRAMSGVCRMLAEEYRHRVSGVPDLIVWKKGVKGSRGEARFVEVKGPGDQLSETQKVSRLHADVVGSALMIRSGLMSFSRLASRSRCAASRRKKLPRKRSLKSRSDKPRSRRRAARMAGIRRG
jgi:Fanconi-associated nuclease 1